MAIFCLATSIKDLKERLGKHRRRLHARSASRSSRGPQGARRDDRAAARRDRAESRADAREQSGVHPRRPVREHRARLQLGDGHADRAEARRLRRDRSGLRRRPRRGEVRRHQVPQGGAQAFVRGDRRDGARAQVPRRRARSPKWARRISPRWRRASPNLERHIHNVRNHYGLPRVVAINSSRRGHGRRNRA